VQTIYIKAIMKDTTFVLMAEAVALALATTITNLLGLQQVSFLSDNQQLVHFLNAPNQANPPDRRIKYYTQTFANLSTVVVNRIHRIKRDQNCMADTLARQSFIQMQSSSSSTFICTYSHAEHVQCSLREALLPIALHSVSILTASCC